MITLAMGNGGVENGKLIAKIQEYLQNEYLKNAEDATPIEALNDPVMTTDSFTISPLFFPGGDIGKLAVAGTCNDVAMMGAKPRFLTLSFIIEEGLSFAEFEGVLQSMSAELANNEAAVVAGDTKVVPKGVVDKLFINISAVGERRANFSQRNIQEGDLLLISRDIGAHGATIFAAREGMELMSDLASDCASLWPVVNMLIKSGAKVKALRDATRGGVAAVLNEWAQATGLCMEIEESKVGVNEQVRGICELLGFDPFILANEGTFVVAVAKEDAEMVLDILQKHNENAALVGEVTKSYPGRVVLKSEWGTRRFLDMPSGEILPRIC